MVNGKHGVGLSAATEDDGQSGVGGGSPTGGNGSKAPEQTNQQGGAEQGDDFTDDVRKQCHRPQFGSFAAGNQNAGERIVPHTRPHGETIGSGVAQKEAHHPAPHQCAAYGRQGQKSQTRVQRPEPTEGVGTVTDTDSHTTHQRTQGIETQVAATSLQRQPAAIPAPYTAGKAPHDIQASFQRTLPAGILRLPVLHHRRGRSRSMN